ncbi:hypothetical protein D3C72_1950440 [compost metagenome]
MNVKPGSSSYSLKSQKLTITISARGIRKNSANTSVNGAACHQAAMPRPGAALDGRDGVVVVLMVSWNNL